MLAEFVENATIFSPPNTEVRVTGDLVAKGLAVDIEDRGLGMDDEEFAAVNASLADPPLFDPSGSDRLGLFVAAQLARRHDIQVRLRPSDYGGVLAIVLIPLALVVAADGSGDGCPRRSARSPRSTAGPRGHRAGAAVRRRPCRCVEPASPRPPRPARSACRVPPGGHPPPPPRSGDLAVPPPVRPARSPRHAVPARGHPAACSGPAGHRAAAPGGGAARPESGSMPERHRLRQPPHRTSREPEGAQVGLTENGLPQRIRQMSLAPQLRNSAASPPLANTLASPVRRKRRAA